MLVPEYKFTKFTEKDEDYKYSYGIIKAEIFHENFVSDTGRYYEEGFFSHIIENIKERIEHRTLYGLFNENPQRMTESIDFSEGKICVVVKNLYVENFNLIAEFLVLKSISGEILHNHILKNKPIHVALRAVGKMLEDIKYQNEYYIIDKESYHLEGIDIFIK